MILNGSAHGFIYFIQSLKFDPGTDKKCYGALISNIDQHDVIDVIWRLPVWNVKSRRYLASCTLQLWSNLTKISFQGRHFNYFSALL